MSSSEQPPEAEPANPDDVEDGEITDDDEEEIPPEPAAQPEPNPATAGAQPTIPVIRRHGGSISDSDSIGASSREQEQAGGVKSDDKDPTDEKDKFGRGRNRDRKNKDNNRGNSKEKGHRHMTEAERSILHLRKKEKMLREREKWEKPWVKPEDDDFAKNIEKTLASILNKKEKEVAALSAGEDAGKDDEKRGKKRKKDGKEKRSKNKHRKTLDSPRSEIDENEMLNIRSGSPGADQRLQGPPPPIGGPYPPMEHQHQRHSGTPSRSDESYNSELSSEEREERTRRRIGKQHRKKKEKRNRREREQRQRNHREDPTKALQDSQGVCVFYLQGKCQKNDCPYSHEVSPPMKLELCKFYLMECCAKGENCSYMHSEFPCKFYHTGLPCDAGKDCKFAHGKPLSDGLKQILFKHIETAPRDILQGFPRLSRDEALNLINQTQKKLADQYGQTTSTMADTNTTSSLSSTSLTHSSPSSTVTQQQQQHYGDQVDLYGGLGMYRDESAPSNDMDQDGGSKGGIPSLFDITVPVPRQLDFDPKTGKKNKNSRWQHDQHNSSAGYINKGGYHYGTDQDMRFSSQGDVDMRTLPTIPSSTSMQDSSALGSDYQNDNRREDVDIRQFPKDMDIRIPNPFGRKIPPPLPLDVDNRHIIYEAPNDQSQVKNDGFGPGVELPQTTRDLLARINATQKDNTDDVRSDLQNKQPRNVQPDYQEQNINWYSDDDDEDDNRLTIKVEEEETNRRERQESTSDRDMYNHEQDGQTAPSSFLSPPAFNNKATDIVGKLGDLSKIDISVEVTKLLSSMSQNKIFPSPACSSATNLKSEENFSPKGGSSPSSLPVDPRINKQAKIDSRPDPRMNDPRRGRQSSTEAKEKEKKPGKISIYEQGGIDMKKAALEIENEDFRGRPDIDLRHMSLPFKGMQNYTPATEIDASINSHPPMAWKVHEVEIPRPDYIGLKLSISDAEKTGDPRLRKIFRLSIDEKDSPASPKASPRQSSGVRIDPRLRKVESVDPKDSPLQGQMSYTQQVSMLQTSQFYQSLTSNQKLMLNQELARCDQSGGGGLNDPVLNTLLTTLNLLPSGGPTNQGQPQMGATPPLGTAGSILANINKMNPLINPNQTLIGGPGLLGAAPGIPNINPNLGPAMNPEYSMNFDPRGAPGILGNPPAQFAQFGGGMEQQGFGGYNDEYYGGFDEQQQGNNMMNQGGNMGRSGNFRQGGRGFNNNRDQRRGGRGNRDGNFRGGRGNHRNFKRGGRDKGDRGDRDRRDGGRGNRGHSPQ